MLKHLLTLLVCSQAMFIGTYADKVLEVSKKEVVGSFEGPTAIAVDGGYAYVCNLVGRSVNVIDIQTNSVVSTIQDPTMNAPFKISVINGYAYVCNLHTNTVSVLDTAHHQFVTTIAEDIQASGNIVTALVSGAPRAFIVDEGVMQVLDLTVPTRPRVLQTLFDPSINGLGVSVAEGQESFVYVTAGSGIDQGGLLVYSQIGTLVGSAPIPLTAPHITGGRLLNAITTVGNAYAYVCDQLNDSVLIYDLATNAYLTSIEGFIAPTALASNGNDVYVCNFGGFMSSPQGASSESLRRSFKKNNMKISVIDASNHIVKGSVDGFYAPQALATVPGFPEIVYFVDASGSAPTGAVRGGVSQAIFLNHGLYNQHGIF